MTALITGASSGLGAEFAKLLSQKGYDIIAVARRNDKLMKLKDTLQTKVTIICLDLSVKDNAKLLYEKVKDIDIDVVINNAGYGMFGEFIKTDLDRELNMINLNCSCVHILTKLFARDFVKKDKGYIMNVASSAGFAPGPLMATYYATKAYVKNLSSAVYQELKKTNSHVHVCSLCPGPVDTEFNDVAGVAFGVKALTSEYVAAYALKKMYDKKVVIVPGRIIKLSTFATRIVPHKMLLKVTYNIQKAKLK